MQSDRRTMDRQHRDDRRYGGDRRYEGDRRHRDDRYHKDDRHRKDDRYRRDDRRHDNLKKRSRSRSRSPNAKRIRRGDAASPDKPNPPAPSTLAANEKETDARRLSQRRKEITYGKNTLGYDRYTRLVPKEKRSRQDPRTPDVTGKYSKRQFDGIVKAWRRRLHEWDPPADELGPSVVPAQVAAPPPAPAVAAAAEPPAAAEPAGDGAPEADASDDDSEDEDARAKLVQEHAKLRNRAQHIHEDRMLKLHASRDACETSAKLVREEFEKKQRDFEKLQREHDRKQKELEAARKDARVHHERQLKKFDKDLRDFAHKEKIEHENHAKRLVTLDDQHRTEADEQRRQRREGRRAGLAEEETARQRAREAEADAEVETERHRAARAAALALAAAGTGMDRPLEALDGLAAPLPARGANPQAT